MAVLPMPCLTNLSLVVHGVAFNRVYPFLCLVFFMMGVVHGAVLVVATASNLWQLS